MAATKRCNECGRELPATEFYKCRGNSDGLQYKCKACKKMLTQKHREANPEWWADHGRKMRAKHRERVKKAKLAYRHRTGAHAVHESVRKAAKRGRLHRPDHCSRCGKECRPVAHHEDYSKRWDVTWLCVKCHPAVHRGAK